jgi:aminoglycoside phosphotransferase family enzyme/predicted kinase
MNLATEKIIEELARPEAWPDPVDYVEVRQTHISVIFLAGNKVLKIKKPVDFGFLDFTTLEKRRHFCEEEVQLNRRLSPEIYLGVLPITEEPDGLRLKGPGKQVEYGVLMKRLDEEKLLSAQLDKSSVGITEMKRIAGKIAAFHKEAPTSNDITHIGGTKAVVFNTEENFQQIEPYIGKTLQQDTFKRISNYTRSFINANANLFRQRETGGWIRDGHGDLHTQHICLADDIQIFDCIEFNERFRYGDILSDAAFLVMDLDRLGFTDLALAFRTTYLELMGQQDQIALLNFFACYRAVVRGKVEGFRFQDPGITECEALTAKKSAGAFHKLAEKYARTLWPPTLIITCGFMGSGKSTYADNLMNLLDLKVISSDRIRKGLAGLEPFSKRHVPFGTDIYTSEFTGRTYQELHRRAMEFLEKGSSVLLDASYVDSAMRAEALTVAKKAGVRALLIHFKADSEILKNRLIKRGRIKSEVSDGRVAILVDQVKTFQPPSEIPEDILLSVDTSMGLEKTLKTIYLRLLSTT